MGAIQRITVELPEDVAERLRARVAAGEFASESAAIVEALLAQEIPGANEAALEPWMAGAAEQVYREWCEGRLDTVSAAELAEQIAADRAEDATHE